MLWLWDLGRAIEFRMSPWQLALLVAVTGVPSNLGQFYFDGPRFGGMSGVVYGLLGYIWIQGHLNPRAGLFLHKRIAIMIMVWYALCWTGLVGPVANMAHTVGLLAGLAAGLISAYAKRG
jgi:GlpG protein